MELSHRLGNGALRGSRFSLAALQVRLTNHLLVTGIACVLVVVALALGHFTSFYSVDGDIKYLAALNLAHHFPNPAISYPWRAFDPDGHYTLPLTAWYSGQDYAGYSLPFLYIAAVAIALFGSGGLVLPAVLGTVILVYAQLRLARLIGLNASPVLVAVTTVFATPLLFYSVSFWEHSWGVALLLAGIVAALEAATRQRGWMPLAAASGLLIAGAVLMRRDTLVPGLLFLVLLPPILRSRRAAAVSLLAGLALILPIAAIVLLHPEPFAVGLTHASPGRAGIGIRQGLSRLDKLEFLFTGGWAMALTGLLLVGCFLLSWLRPKLVIPAAAVGSLLCGVSLVFVMLNRYTFSNENVLAFCPLAIWGLLLPFIPRTRPVQQDRPAHVRPRQTFSAPVAALKNGLAGASNPKTGMSSVTGRQLSLLWLVAVGGCVAVVEAASDSGGAQWGPRYLLFAFPALVLLALKARERMLDYPKTNPRLVNYAFVALLGLSFLLQGLGLFALHVKQDLALRGQSAVMAEHSRLVVSAFPVIDLLAPRYETGTYLYASTQRDLNKLMARLRAQGKRRLVLLCDPVYPCEWSGYSGWRHGRVHRVASSVRFAVYTSG